jgi:uncharacterized membrane protein YecN with MAPEG domain
MAKMTAWLVTLIGALLVLGQLVPALSMDQTWVQWIIALAVLVVGIGKLMRNYKVGGKKR